MAVILGEAAMESQDQSENVKQFYLYQYHHMCSEYYKKKHLAAAFHHRMVSDYLTLLYIMSHHTKHSEST